MSASPARALWRRHDGERGQAAFEFAAIIVPLFLLLFLILDGGMFFSQYEHVTNEVREGARCSVVGGTDTNVRNRVLAAVPGGSVTVSRSTDDNGDGVTGGIGDNVLVSATWTYTWITPLSAFGFGATTTKTSSAAMRLETSTFTKPCPG
jgi:Flp pilus assembly protein TadG